jgi:hypothetical protein
MELCESHSVGAAPDAAIFQVSIFRRLSRANRGAIL